MSKEQQDMYDLYSLILKDMTVDEDSVDENSTDAPIQRISLPSISQKSYKELSPNDKKKLNDLYKKIGNSNTDIQKYSNFFMGYPLAFDVNGKTYLVAPTDKDSREYVIMDEDGNIINDKIELISFSKGGNELNINDEIAKQSGKNGAYITSNDYDTIDIIDTDGNEKKLTQGDFSKKITEVLIENHYMNKLKHRAGIIK
jgi:hypothetical protein